MVVSDNGSSGTDSVGPPLPPSLPFSTTPAGPGPPSSQSNSWRGGDPSRPTSSRHTGTLPAPKTHLPVLRVPGTDPTHPPRPPPLTDGEPGENRPPPLRMSAGGTVCRGGHGRRRRKDSPTVHPLGTGKRGPPRNEGRVKSVDRETGRRGFHWDRKSVPPAPRLWVGKFPLNTFPTWSSHERPNTQKKN